MSLNNATTKLVPVKKFTRTASFEVYDRLRPELRAIVQQAPVKCFLDNSLSAAEAKRRIDSLRAKLAWEAYGPDHPEAASYVNSQPSAEGLGL